MDYTIIAGFRVGYR